MPNKPTTLTTIQTIKEAEDRFENKFCYPKGHIVAGLLKSGLDEEDIQSHITQTLLAVFESELESVPENRVIELNLENQPISIQDQIDNGINQERARLRSHLTEVINYLKQK